jgi:hypothetical protein
MKARELRSLRLGSAVRIPSDRCYHLNKVHPELRADLQYKVIGLRCGLGQLQIEVPRREPLWLFAENVEGCNGSKA